MNRQKKSKLNNNNPQRKMDPIREAITRRAKSIMDTLTSMRDFEHKTGIPYSTLQHWTDIHKNGLPETSVGDFINALKVYGIECSHEWMMYGKGAEPKMIDRLTTISANELSKKSLIKHRSDEGQTAEIAEELEVFLQSDKEAISYIVPDDAMEPRFIQGELVAGVRRYGKDIEKLTGQDCIVLIENRGEFCLRTLRKGNLPEHFLLAPTNSHTQAMQPFISDVKVVSAAPVIWARRRDRF